MSKLISNKKRLRVHRIGTLKAGDRIKDHEVVSSWEYAIIMVWRALLGGMVGRGNHSPSVLRWFIYGLLGVAVMVFSAILFEPVVRWLLEGLVSFSLLLATHESATVGMP
tara:strand:+ start:907 stop:1236 length:330 start_codon:yes stop_codon:yes gene_type:complete